MYKNILLKRGLVVGIIALFIGVAVIPSVNSIDIVRSKNIQEIIDNSVIETSDSEEDCNCEVVSKSDIYRIERLLNRLELIVKIISIRFRNNPEVKEKYEELSNKITIFKEINQKLKKDYSISKELVCIYFLIMCKYYRFLFNIVYDLDDVFYDYPIIARIFTKLEVYYYFRNQHYHKLYFKYDCY